VPRKEVMPGGGYSLMVRGIACMDNVTSVVFIFPVVDTKVWIKSYESALVKPPISIVTTFAKVL
jgi:hypothetical protein